MTQQMWRVTTTAIAVAMLGAAAVAADQTADRVLANAREALGGDTRLGAVRTLRIIGNTTRQRPDNSTAEHAFEMAFEAPGRFVQRSVMAALGPTSVYRHSGFDGDTVIEWIDTPPALAGGGNNVIQIDVRGPGDEGPATTPEQIAARNVRAFERNRHEFARLSLGMFAAAPANYPLTFRHAGVAESPDGRADIIAVTGPNGFAANLFIDVETHLPLMVSWQAPEPVQVVVERSGPEPESREVRAFDGGRGAGPLAPGAMENRPLVEHRLVFADVRTFDGGVRLPTRLQRLIAGRTVEETVFERVRINERLDARTFATRP